MSVTGHELQMITRVLSSRRLIAEHIEILEDFLNTRQLQDVSGRKVIATTIGAISLTGTGILMSKYFINPASGIISSGGGVVLGIIAGRQWMDVYRDWKDVQQFTSLLDNLNKYHSLLKRNLTYLTDVSLLNGALNTRERMLVQSCIESTLRVVEILHTFVSKLDEIRPITKELPNYQPFEDLGSCPAISEQRGDGDQLKHFKEIYTIFLYIQSQFVLRVCIARVDNPSAKKELQEVISHFQLELKREDLQPIRTKEQPEIKCLDLMKTRPGSGNELGQLKWTTSNLTTKLMVQLSQFEKFNDKLSSVVNISSTSELSVLREDLLALESLFVSTACEFENVQILLRKISNTDPECAAKENNMIVEHSESMQDPPVIDQNTAITIDDEFFILDGQLAEKHDNAKETQGDDPREEKLLKTCFKPVLRQLRKEIGSLNEDMAARERKFLQQQGQLPLAVDPKPLSLSNGSSTESEDELDDNLVLRKKKYLPRPSKYDENRQFLEEKVGQQGMFRLPLPMSFPTPSSEDVLE